MLTVVLFLAYLVHTAEGCCKGGGVCLRLLHRKQARAFLGCVERSCRWHGGNTRGRAGCGQVTPQHPSLWPSSVLQEELLGTDICPLGDGPRRFNGDGGQG